MVTAVILALVVSATAAVVLTLTLRRFELSAFRTDHAVAEASAEAGLQYAFARLDKDSTSTNSNFPSVQGFKKLVQAKREKMGTNGVDLYDEKAEYIVSCHHDPGITEDEILDPPGTGPLQPAALHMGGVLATAAPGGLRGGKHVRVLIRFFTDKDLATSAARLQVPAGRPYRVKASSFYGTGEEWR